MATPINVTYFPIRGLVEPVVTLLEFVGLPYTITTVESRPAWEEIKKDLPAKGCEFPNLPLLEHEGKFKTESFAQLAYVAKVAKRFDLLPTQENFDRFLELFGVISDLYPVFTMIAYTAKSDDEIRHHIVENLKRHNQKLVSLSNILATQKWLKGDQISILDFRFAELLEKMLVMDEELKLESFGMDISNFKRYLNDFAAIPQIAAYRTSDKFKMRPFNNLHAYWK